jgi:hypothetical protein
MWGRSTEPRSTVNRGNASQQPIANSRFSVRHRRPTAHARARYRCFLPDLAGLAGRRRAGPMPDKSILASGFRWCRSSRRVVRKSRHIVLALSNRCHPERRKPIRFANRFPESKDQVFACASTDASRSSCPRVTMLGGPGLGEREKNGVPNASRCSRHGALPTHGTELMCV